VAGASQVALDSVLHAPGPVGGLLLTSVWLCVVVRFGGVVDVLMAVVCLQWHQCIECINALEVRGTAS
jgi:hypothetical protein